MLNYNVLWVYLLFFFSTSNTQHKTSTSQQLTKCYCALYYIDEIVDYSYLDDLGRDVTQLQQELRKLEKQTFNTNSKGGQFAQITVDEVRLTLIRWDKNEEITSAVSTRNFS